MNLRWNDCLKIGVSIFCLYLGIHYFPAALKGAGLLLGASMPLILGACVAYVVGILMSAFERGWHGGSPAIRRAACLVMAYLSLITAVVLIVALILHFVISKTQYGRNLCFIFNGDLRFVNALSVSCNKSCSSSLRKSCGEAGTGNGNNAKFYLGNVCDHFIYLLLII